MKEKIQIAVIVILCIIFVTVVFCRAHNDRLYFGEKNETMDVIETEPEVVTTSIPLQDIVDIDVVDIPETPIVEEQPEIIEEPEPVEEPEIDVVEEPEPTPTPEPEPIKYYTHDDVIAMAKLMYGEAGAVQDLYIWDGRVISSEYQKACVVWTVLNRYDMGWEDSIIKTVSAYQQFHGYDPDNPVTEELTILAYDVLERWNKEKNGEENVGRVLPPEYVYFYGDLKTNWFMDEYKDWETYNWDLEDPYM